MSKRPIIENHPSRLNKVADNTGRTHGASAAPTLSEINMVSPLPQQDIRGNIDSISNDFRNTSVNLRNTDRINNTSSRKDNFSDDEGSRQHNQSVSFRSVASPVSQGVRIPNEARGSSSYQTNQKQDTRYNDRGNASPSTRQGHARQSSARYTNFNELSAKFMAKITDVRGMMARCKDLPKDLQDKLVTDLRQIWQQYSEQHRNIMKDMDQFEYEQDDLKRQLRLSQETQGRLVIQNKDLELKHTKSVEKSDELEIRWKRIQEDLMDQIARQKEQIDGKRALWIDQNPGSSARRDAMQALRDPFNSPSASQNPGFTGGLMSTMTSPSIVIPSGVDFASTSMIPPKFAGGHVPPVASFTASQFFPSASGKNAVSSIRGDIRTRNETGPPPALEMRRGGLPTGVPVQSAYMKIPFPPERTIYGSRQTFHTEPGTPPPSSKSNAMVIHKSDEDIAAEYKSLIKKLYDLIEDWVRKYSCIPNETNDRALASSNNVLWDYMMNCTYPGHRQDSHTHVVALLNNPDTRFWFVMRMATQYCVKDIMSIKAFRPYNKGVEKTIDTVLLKLSERGLNNEARQRYIDQGSEAIQAVISAKNFQNFRAQQLGVHTKALRDMLGPLLDHGVTRASAGVDIGAIAVLSWNLSCKMHTARLTFQIYFPETNGKFMAATMEAKDLTNVDPLQLQIEQVRLKLVVTPVITMRDDRGTTIRAKNIHSAMVLLMK